MANKKIVFEIDAINKKFNESVNESVSKSEALRESLSQVAAVSGAAFLGLTAGVGAFVGEAAKIETINTQFEVLTGSVLGAEKAVQQLLDFSAKTPFEFESVAAAGKQLLGFGFATEELTDRLKEIGNVAAASGAPVNELSLIYGQVSAAGRLMGDRLLQMQEKAIPIGPALAKTMGVAESAIKDLVSKGQVDFETFQKAFASLSQEGGFAFGGLDKQSQTLSGQLSTLKGNFQLVAVELVNKLLPILKQITTSMNGFLEEVRKNPELIKLAVNILKVATVSTGLVASISGGVLAFMKLKLVLLATAGQLTNIATAFATPVVAIASLVGAIGFMALTWDDKLTLTENITKNWWGRIKTLFSGIGNILKSVFTLDPQGIKDGLVEASAAFAETIEDMERQKDDLAVKQESRRQEEILAEQRKQQKLRDDEINANLLKEEDRLRRRQELQEKMIAEAEEDRAIQDGLDEARYQLGLNLTKREQKLLAEDIKKKRQQKDESDKKDLIKRIEQRKKEQEIETQFGTAYLAFKKLMDSEEFKSAENLASSNLKLQKSSNAQLQGIGRAAAVTQIGMDSAKGAMAVFAQSVATFPPPIGPAIGAALAAAQIAYGAERIRDVLTAQTGGLVEGTGRGDRVPALLEAGELVVPRQNFEDVVQAEASRRSSEENGATGMMEVLIGFTEDAFEIIEQKIIERRNTGVGLI